MKKILIFAITALLMLGAVIPAHAGLQPFEVEAKAALVMDYDTGQILYAHNIDEALPPASITKLMSMYLIFEALESGQISLDEKVTASSNVLMSADSSQIFLAPGEELTVKELLLSIAIISANDAGVAMAEHIAGSEGAFITLMNDKARELGMTQTNFANVHGLDAANHHMSARDIAILSRAILRDFPDVLDYSSIRHLRLDRETRYVREGHFDLNSTFTSLIGWRNVDGLKTGWTPQAGRGITATSLHNDRRVIAVVLGTETIAIRDAETKKLIDYGHDQFEPRTVLETEVVVETLNIANAREREVNVVLQSDATVLLKPEMSVADLHVEKEFMDDIAAPLAEGEQVGTYRLLWDEETVLEIPLTVNEDVTQANFFVRTLRYLSDALTQLGGWIMDKIS
ncbi:MAG: D-alanyl-D-alanine carboxypeptidase [Firmicutes bacterium]|nr:D-alanyl-D-alanine carboxypeptidase [Bacillota bacterium]